jgi:error-prone DNA polymerase
MCFLSLEDETGLVNVVVTPDLYQKYRLALLYSALLEIEGTLENREGVRNLKAQGVRALELQAPPEGALRKGDCRSPISR